MILGQAFYDVYNYLIQRKSIKKMKCNLVLALSQYLFFGLQEDRLANMTNHYAFIKIKLTIYNGFIFKDTQQKCVVDCALIDLSFTRQKLFKHVIITESSHTVTILFLKISTLSKFGPYQNIIASFIKDFCNLKKLNII